MVVLRMLCGEKDCGVGNAKCLPGLAVDVPSLDQ